MLACLLGALVALAAAQQPQPATPAAPATQMQAPPAGYHFPNGQSYVYDVEWRLWTAGTAVLSVEHEGTEQHVRAAGNSVGTVALLYHVGDRFDAWINSQTFCSRRIT